MKSLQIVAIDEHESQTTSAWGREAVQEELASTLLARCTTVSLFLLVCVGIYATCFRGLNDFSVWHYDETLELVTAQNVRLDGRWWFPTREDGKTLYGKPPLRMWLSFIPLHFLGDSNFAFRFADAFAGAMTILLTFLFVRARFASTLCGSLAAFALMGCKGYVNFHGVRMGVPDSVLVFFSTVSMFAMWYIVHATRRRLLWAVIAGIGIGCGILTKNLPGIYPLFAFGPYMLFSGKVFTTNMELWKPLVLMGVVSLFVPALYFVPHFIWTDGAYELFVYHELIHRASSGWHHKEWMTYYIDFLLQKKSGVPPVLLLASLAWGVLSFLRFRDHRIFYLFCWVVFPISVFTFADSRLYWYISPSLPAMSGLVGVMVFGLIVHGMQTIRRGKMVSGIPAVGASLYALFLLGSHLVTVQQGIADEPPRYPIDYIAENYREIEAKGVDLGPVVFHETPQIDSVDKFYITVLNKPITRAHTKDELKEVLFSHDRLLLFTTFNAFFDVMAMREVKEYLFLPPMVMRKRWMVVAFFANDLALKTFRDMDLPYTSESFAIGSLDYVNGWGRHYFPRGDKLVRKNSERTASVIVELDHAYRYVPTEFVLNASLGSNAKEDTMVRVSVNGRPVGDLAFVKGEFRDGTVRLPKESWLVGNNVISFQVLPGSLTSEKVPELFFHELKISLLQKEASMSS